MKSANNGVAQKTAVFNQKKDSSNSRKKAKLPDWVFGDKTITHDAVNKLLEIPDSRLTPEALSQACEKLLQTV